VDELQAANSRLELDNTRLQIEVVRTLQGILPFYMPWTVDEEHAVKT
jgi:hypothetical protein